MTGQTAPTCSDIDLKASYQISKSLISRRNNDGTVILMKTDATNLFYKIDGIAAAVFSEMKEPCSVSSLLERFSKQYTAHSEVIAKDIPGLIQDLLKNDLIVKA